MALSHTPYPGLDLIQHRHQLVQHAAPPQVHEQRQLRGGRRVDAAITGAEVGARASPHRVQAVAVVLAHERPVDVADVDPPVPLRGIEDGKSDRVVVQAIQRHELHDCALSDARGAAEGAGATGGAAAQKREHQAIEAGLREPLRDVARGVGVDGGNGVGPGPDEAPRSRRPWRHQVAEDVHLFSGVESCLGGHALHRVLHAAAPPARPVAGGAAVAARTMFIVAPPDIGV